MKLFKKSLALLLCLVMLISMVPGYAMAADDETLDPAATEDAVLESVEEEGEALEPTGEEEETLEPVVDEIVPEDEADAEPLADGDVARIGDTYYATLADAVTAAAAGDTIVLVADFSYSTAVTVTKKITIKAESAVTVTKTGPNEWLLIESGGDVTLEGPITVVGTSGKYGALIEIASKGILTMNAGITLKDNMTSKSTIAGGVNIVDGTFTMNGGTISGCGSTGSTAPTSSSGSTMGGGVRVSLTKNSTVDASFVMNGGTISNCSSFSGGAVGIENLYNSKGSTASFTMNGGTITGCSSRSSSANKGGGAAVALYNKIHTSSGIEGATFTMNGGTITGNSAPKYGTIYPYTSGSGNTYGAHIYILGGEISGNFVGSGTNNSPGSVYGNGVYLDRLINSTPLLTIGGNAIIDDEVFLKSSTGNYFEILDNFTGYVKVCSQAGGIGSTPVYGSLVAKQVSATGVASTATSEIAGKITALYLFLDDNNQRYEHPVYDVVRGTNSDEYVLGEYASAVVEYTVTYTDGVDGEEIFADQTHTVEEGSATPAFVGTPSREGYEFTGWDPAVAETVTADVIYTATWEETAPEAPHGGTDKNVADGIYKMECYTWDNHDGNSVSVIEHYPGTNYATNGEVTKNAEGKWTCDVTVRLKAVFEENYLKGIFSGHRLVSELPETEVFTAVWDSEKSLWVWSETPVYELTCKAEKVEISGGIIRAHLNPTKGSGRIYVDLENVSYNESVELKLYSGDTLLTTATLNTTEYPGPTTFGELTGSICMVAGESDTWPNTAWTAWDNVVPDKIELVIDGTNVVDTCIVIYSSIETEIYVPMTDEDWVDFPGTAPAVPNGNNVTTSFVTMICDTDPDHEAVTVKWQSGTIVYPITSTPVWNDDLGAWTIGVRIDMIGTKYVWPHFEEKYDDINHDLVASDLVNTEFSRIDTQLKWSETSGMWVTMDGKPIEIHLTCKTQPTAPNFTYDLSNYQIKVTGMANGEEQTRWISLIENSVEIGEVTGNRKDGFTVAVKVTLQNNDGYMTGWLEQCTPNVRGYIYNEIKPANPITFTLKYTGDTTSDLYGDRAGDWVWADTGDTFGTVGEAYIGFYATVIYTDGVDGVELFKDQTYYSCMTGSATPEFEGTPEREGYTFGGWSLDGGWNPDDWSDTVTGNVTYTAIWVPNAPEKLGGNVIDPLLTIICDSDEDHAALTGKWYSTSCKVYPSDSTPVWDEELGAWTIGVRIQSLSIFYVDEMKDTYNDIWHDLVDGKGSVEDEMIVTTLKWDAAQELWVPTEAIEIHTECKTVPDAPSYMQLKSYQIQVFGLANGEEVTYTTSIPEGGYTVGEVKGSREEGFTVDITVTLAEGDAYITNWIAERNPGVAYVYDWDKTPATVTYTLTYNGDLNGTLYGSRHASNSNYDWIIGFKTNANGSTSPMTWGVVADAYVKEDIPAPYYDTITDELVTVVCDSDSDRHQPVTGQWYKQHSNIYSDTLAWNAELSTWTIDIRIDGLYIMYVSKLEKENGNTQHTIVGEDTRSIFTTLKWDYAQKLWVPVEDVVIHTECRTAPLAPVYEHQLDGYQIKVFGDPDHDGDYSENNGIWTTNVPETSYTEISEVYGSREEGFFVDVTIAIEEGDAFITNWILQKDPGEDYIYNWDKTPKTIKLTLKYTGDLNGTLHGDRYADNVNVDWVLTTTGKDIGVVGEAYVLPAVPEAPVQSNVTTELVTIICDSDPDRHATVYGKWYPQNCETKSEIVWNAELCTYTVDVRVGSLDWYYVHLTLERAYNDIHHELVGDNYVDTTLVWDLEAKQWVPAEAIEVHATCQTVPTAPTYEQLEAYQIKVWGAVDGEEEAYTTSIPENGYTIGEVKGSREEGFTVDITVAIEEGDVYISNWIAEKAPGASYAYDWSKTPKTVTFTLKYNGSLTGTLYGDRHASNTNYDWVLSTNDKTYGVVGEAYVHYVVAHNVNTGKYYTTVAEALALGEVQTGETVELVANAAESVVMIYPGVTLDLKDHTLTALYVNGLKDSYLTATLNEGKLVVDPNYLVLSETSYVDEAGYNVMPIWNPNGYFVFSRFQVSTTGTNRGLTITKDEIYFQFVVNTSKFARTELLIDGAGDNEVSIIVRLEWETENGTAYQDFVYNDTQISAVSSGGRDYGFSLSGYEALEINLDTLKVKGMVVTNCGATTTGVEWTQ